MATAVNSSPLRRLKVLAYWFAESNGVYLFVLLSIGYFYFSYCLEIGNDRGVYDIYVETGKSNSVSERIFRRTLRGEVFSIGDGVRVKDKTDCQNYFGVVRFLNTRGGKLDHRRVMSPGLLRKRRLLSPYEKRAGH